ncbi:hypothetical protein ACWC9R_15285 [Streptomyces sp. NPDC001219]
MTADLTLHCGSGGTGTEGALNRIKKTTRDQCRNPPNGEIPHRDHGLVRRPEQCLQQLRVEQSRVAITSRESFCACCRPDVEMAQ